MELSDNELKESIHVTDLMN